MNGLIFSAFYELQIERLLWCYQLNILADICFWIFFSASNLLSNLDILTQSMVVFRTVFALSKYVLYFGVTLLETSEMKDFVILIYYLKPV